MKKNTKIILIALVVIVILTVVGIALKGSGVLFAPTTQCNDRYDNDKDGKCDYGSGARCRDGSARRDSGCSSSSDNSEASCIINSTTCGVGACQRSSTCVNDNVQCVPGTPGTEICGNGIDEDCNGADLACPPPVNNTNITCVVGSISCGVGACQRSSTCVNNQVSCAPGTPTTEICGNGIDEDCNGADLACVLANSCTDTDGGIVTTLKGTVSGILNGANYSYTDVCDVSANSTIYIRENYCSSNRSYVTVRSCAGNTTSSCSDGACI